MPPPVYKNGTLYVYQPGPASPQDLAAARKLLVSEGYAGADRILKRLGPGHVEQLAQMPHQLDAKSGRTVDRIVKIANARDRLVPMLVDSRQLAAFGHADRDMPKASATPESQPSTGRRLVGGEAANSRRASLLTQVRKLTERYSFSPAQVAALDKLDDAKVKELLRAAAEDNVYYGKAWRLPELVVKYTNIEFPYAMRAREAQRVQLAREAAEQPIAKPQVRRSVSAGAVAGVTARTTLGVVAAVGTALDVRNAAQEGLTLSGKGTRVGAQLGMHAMMYLNPVARVATGIEGLVALGGTALGAPGVMTQPHVSGAWRAAVQGVGLVVDGVSGTDAAAQAVFRLSTDMERGVYGAPIQAIHELGKSQAVTELVALGINTGIAAMDTIERAFR